MGAKCQTQPGLFFESIGMFGAAQGHPAIITPGYWWPSEGTQWSMALLFNVLPSRFQGAIVYLKHLCLSKSAK